MATMPGVCHRYPAAVAGGEDVSEESAAVGGRWVGLMAAAELAPGSISGQSVGDLDVVVWRTTGGRLVAQEARCPHQWSHLAAEGVVDGDEIVCTAHFWRFDAEGTGTKVNIGGRRDPKADIITYRVRESGGRIAVYLGD